MTAMHEVGQSEVEVYGPEATVHWLYAQRYYLKREGFSIDAHLYNSSHSLRVADHVHHGLTVRPIVVVPDHAHDGSASVDGVSAAGDLSSASAATAEGGFVGRDAFPAPRRFPHLRAKFAAPDENPSHFPRPHSGAGAPTVISYFAWTPRVVGTFRPEKAVARGVPRGPAFGLLKRGEPYTTDDGTIIHPEDVKDPDSPGMAFLVASCPSVDYLDAFVKHPAWLTAGTLPARLLVVLHCAPRSVVECDAYQHWKTSSFGPSVTHYYLHPTCQASSDCGALRTLPAKPIALQRSLQRLDSELFPLPVGLQPDQNSSERPFVGGSCLRVGTTIVIPGTRRKSPGVEMYFEDQDPTTVGVRAVAAEEELLWQRWTEAQRAEYVENPSAQENAPSALIQSLPHLPALPATTTAAEQESTPSDGSTVIFLGTSSAVPSKYRNVTSILVRFSAESDWTLLDAGEATWHQLCIYFGRECERTAVTATRPSAEEVLRRWRVSWISHIHADHQTGLPLLLQKRQCLWPELQPVLVLGPPFMGKLLSELAELDPYLCGSYVFRPVTDFLAPWSQPFISKPSNRDGSAVEQDVPPPNWSAEGFRDSRDWKEALHSGRDPDPAIFLRAIAERLDVPSEPAERDDSLVYSSLEAAGIRRVLCVPTWHCFNSYAVRLEGGTRSLVFSGDSQPCASVIRLAYGCTQLIHEATFEDGMELTARARWHATVGEATAVGMCARAHRTVLTHFSARYPKVPVAAAGHGTGVAYDWMTLSSLAALERLPSLLPALHALHSSDGDKNDDNEDGDEREEAPAAKRPRQG